MTRDTGAEKIIIDRDVLEFLTLVGESVMIQKKAAPDDVVLLALCVGASKRLLGYPDE
jgi:hypothetical protein